MAEVRQWLSARRFDGLFDALVYKLGVQTLSDLPYVTNDDIPTLGLMPVQRRRFEHELSTFIKATHLYPPSCSSPDETHCRTTAPSAPAGGAATHPDGCAPTQAREMLVPPRDTQSRGGSGGLPAMTEPSSAGGHHKEVIGTLPTTAPASSGDEQEVFPGVGRTDTSDDSDDQLYDDDGCSSSGDDSTGAPPPPVKRRKVSLSAKQKASSAAAHAAGISRWRRRDKLGNGTAAGPSQACSSSGVSRLGHSADVGCSCVATLTDLGPQLAVAKRSAQEKAQAAARCGKQSAIPNYNYARLGLLVTTLLFDARGNWLVHERCARVFLGVSNSWMANRHKLAIQAARAPIDVMTKSEIAAHCNPDATINRIIRPDSCLLSLRQYFMNSPMNTRFELTSKVSDHGLAGSPSNRRKRKERALFLAFVNKHRSPTGRTADKSGRYHGAAYYLDAKWVVLRPGRSKNGVVDNRRCFSEDFNHSLVSNGLPRVHPDVPLRWLRELFGSTRRIEGILRPSDEHTTAFPHKTDACATCELLQADTRHSKQVLRRHEQQEDQGTIDRQSAVAVTKQTI